MKVTLSFDTEDEKDEQQVKDCLLSSSYRSALEDIRDFLVQDDLLSPFDIPDFDKILKKYSIVEQFFDDF